MKSIFVSFLVIFAPFLFSGESPEKQPTQVMILASYHMANPGADVINMTSDDVLAPHRQRELEAMIEKLAVFNPNKIAVEIEYPVSGAVDSTQKFYESYKAGEAESSRNEIDQVAFRLAKRLGHGQVYGIDAKIDFPFKSAMTFAQEHDQMRMIQTNLAQGEAMVATFDSWLSKGTIGDFYKKINRKDIVSGAQDFYMNLLYVGKDDRYVGADLVADWYRRNLLILTNILRVADHGGDRILVLIGLGHAHLLRQFVTESPTLTLIEANDFL